MGAENSVLEGCQWGEDVLAASLDWDVQHADTKDSRPITVFQPRKSERKYKDMMEQLAKSLKLLRHPSILRYIGAGKSSEGHFLVTEQATPLASVLDRLSPLEVCAGLSDILDALMFLHDKAGVTHNNVSVGAIFVAKDGGWRLGELQHACPFSAATAEFLDTCRAYRDQSTLSPEEKQGGLEIKADQGHARDVYALGVCMEQLSEQLSELGEFNKTFEQKVGACLSGDPAQRPRVLELKNDKLFQNDFIHILNFVRNVALKTAEEKTEFFSGLLPRLLALPEELVAHRLAIPLLSRFVLLEEAAVNHVVPHLLTPKPDSKTSSSPCPDCTPVLSADLFRAHLIQELQRIFLVHDEHIRLVVLQYFSRYAHLFELDVLQGEIFPQILLGLRDTSDAIVASSLRALADLMPLLGGDVVIGGQRKTFFFHGMPKFSPDRGEQPGCVTDILKPVRSGPSLSNGKPLLLDLAAGSSHKLNRGPEQERKLLEREQRREEAHRRKEERQRKLKLQNMQAEEDRQKVESTDTDTLNIMKSDEAEKVLNSDNLHDLDSNPDNGKRDLEISKKLGKSVEGGDDSVNEDDKDKLDKDRGVEEEKFASEESAEEWEDWDENEVESVQKSQDELISDEIEAELSHMSGSKSQGGTGEKVPTSPDPYHHGSPAKMDWSDSQFNSGIGASNSHHFGSDQMGQETATQNISSQKSASHPDSRQASMKGLKLTKNKTATSASTKTKKISGGDDLGLGYDIKSIELTAVKEEVDFFADMMPDIKPSVDKGVALPVIATDKDTTAGDVTKGLATSARFAVTDEAPEEEAGGWGDDEDWGSSDF